MRRSGPILALAAATLMGGCAYDPYTRSYEPCCYFYPYGYYGYPPPTAVPYGYPPGAYGAPPPQSPPPPQPGAGYGPAPPGPRPGPTGAAPHIGLAERFAAANTTHDGRLTREQAAAGMPMVARRFDAIDVGHKGYVTLPEIRAFLAQRRPQGATRED